MNLAEEAVVILVVIVIRVVNVVTFVKIMRVITSGSLRGDCINNEK